MRVFYASKSFMTIALATAFSFAAAVPAAVPEHTVDATGVHLKGVGPDNPIIYDKR